MNTPTPDDCGWRGLLFPRQPRSFPMRRGLRLVLRTAHIFFAGTLLGGVIFGQPWADLQAWWMAMLISGLLLFATDLHASLSILLQLCGLAVVAKIAMTALVGWYPEYALSLLLGALVIGSISSHMPGRYRHLAPAFADRLVAGRHNG